MKRYILLALALIIGASIAGGVVMATSAGATPPVDENGCTGGEVFWQGSCQAPSTPITICHVAGLASDPANFVTLNVTLAAAVGQAGHFGENGTPNAGHEQDTIGPCELPPPPEEETGCVPGDEPGEYYLATYPAGQAPEGAVQQGTHGLDENCEAVNVDNPPNRDLCLNLGGVQTTVPVGYVMLADRRCVPTADPAPPSNDPPGTNVGDCVVQANRELLCGEQG